MFEGYGVVISRCNAAAVVLYFDGIKAVILEANL